MNNTADAPIFAETISVLGFDPGEFEKMPDLACIKCEKLDHELDHNAMCPQCVENARDDEGLDEDRRIEEAVERREYEEPPVDWEP